MTQPVGIIVNPRSGGDIRRAVAAAGRSTLEDKLSIVRRIVLGARAVGVRTFLVNHEPMQIVRRATETLRDIEIVRINDKLLFTEEDSTLAAAAMSDHGAAAVAVLGGDGTNRAVVKGWPDIPLMPVSTGTNNAFPVFIEPTVAGTTLGLVAVGAVDLSDVSTVAKLVHVEIDGPAGLDEPDIALIDAVAVADPYVGSLELFEPDTMRLAVLTRADPAAIGFSAVGGLLEPLTEDEDAALLVRFAPVDGHTGPIIHAPTAPGHHSPIGIVEVRRLAFGETITVPGLVLLAFDGERKRRVHDGQTATLSVRRDGPRVLDPRRVMRAGRGHFLEGGA